MRSVPSLVPDRWIVHNDWPAWRDLTAADFFGMRRKVGVDGRRVLRRVAMEGVDMRARGASEPIPVED